MTKFWSALEPISVIIALLMAVVVFAVYRNSTIHKIYASIASGTISLVVMLYLTHCTFEMFSDRVSYGTLFWSRSIPLMNILKVSYTRSLGIIPGTVIVFSLTPVEIEGRLTGRGEIVSVGRWPLPDAKKWMEGVNALAAQKRGQ